MIRPLRRRHLYIWLALAVLLPIGYFLAYLAIPGAGIYEQKFKFGPQEAFSEIVATAETEDIKVNLREDKATGYRQLEFILRAPLERPSTVVYLSARPFTNPEEGRFAVFLDSRGIHRVTLDSGLSSYPVYYLLFYDKIKKEVAEQVALEI